VYASIRTLLLIKLISYGSDLTDEGRKFPILHASGGLRGGELSIQQSGGEAETEQLLKNEESGKEPEAYIVRDMQKLRYTFTSAFLYSFCFTLLYISISSLIVTTCHFAYFYLPS
jgi:hypothetical protein